MISILGYGMLELSFLTACESGCWSTVSDTSITGVVRNLCHPEYSCGGSSSGSARLVAGGKVDMALVGVGPNPRYFLWKLTFSTRVVIKEDLSVFLRLHAAFSD